MTYLELYFAAMYVSEIWFSGYRETSSGRGFRNFCRARGIVMFDRIMTGRAKLERL